MHSKAQTLRNLALLGVLLGLVGNFSSRGNIGASEQQQPPDMCKPPQKSVTVTSTNALLDALNDKDCMEIVLTPGTYTPPNNLILSDRNGLTIKSTRVENPREPYPTIEGQLNDRQTIYIRNSTNVTIAGLQITTKGQGSTAGVVVVTSSNIELIENVIYGHQRGIDITGSKNITVRGNTISTNTEAGVGVIIEKSTVVPIKVKVRDPRKGSEEEEISFEGFINNKVKNNLDGIQIISSPVTLQDVTVQGNGNGIVAESSSEITIARMVISGNTKNGIWLKNSTLVIKQSEIFRNDGCGINVEGSSVTDLQGRSNTIVANEAGNFCPQPIPDSLATLRKFEAIVPKHFSKIQEALDGAWLYPKEEDEAAKAGRSTFFTIQVQAGTYNENLCIPRSVRLQASGQVKIQGKDSHPVIGIGSDNCPLEGPPDHNITIDGFEISRGSVGVQVGPGPQNSPVKLQIGLKNVLITGNKEKGLWIIGDGKDGLQDNLNIQIMGERPQIFSNLACDVADLRDPVQQLKRDLLKSLDQNATVKIYDNGGDGVAIDARDQAEVTVTLSHAIIGDVVEDQPGQGIKPNKGNGISLMSSSEMPVQLQLSAVWVAHNSKRGLEVELGGKAQNVDINLGAGSTLYRNGDSGLKVANPTISQNLKLYIVDTHVTGNGGHGVELSGQLQAILSTTEPTSNQQPQQQDLKYYCGLFANGKSGLRAELGPDIESPPKSGIMQAVQAQVKIEKLRIEKNKEHGVVAINLTFFGGPALQLTNSRISENLGNGVMLISRIGEKENKVTRLMNVFINNNRFQANKLWGVTRHIRPCLLDRTGQPPDNNAPPDNFYGGEEATGDDRNTFSNNGTSLGDREKRAGYKDQVCPPELKHLIKE